MKHWLIVYERNPGKLLRCDEYSDSHAALQERFTIERIRGGDTNLEIVVLGGSLDTIKRTHSRYFAGAGIRKERKG
jgi:hypothetical protein